MKLILAVLVVFLVVGTQAEWYHFPAEAYHGAKDMWQAYQDMIEANTKESDKYFHARGNYDAAERGPGGKWAAEVISDGVEALQGLRRHGNSDSEADQEASRWGRNGGDPDAYRPKDLSKKY
ncbi:unnamed protein product [Leuciscus chuanchicus]